MEPHRFYPDGPEGQIVPLGINQEVSPNRQRHAMAALEDAETYARRSETHLWLLMVTYKVPDAFLDAQDGRLPTDDPQAILDPDSMLGMPALVCYVCEQGYDRRLRFRKCKGERS